MKRVFLLIIFVIFFALSASAEIVEGNGYRVDYVIGAGGLRVYVAGQPAIGELKGSSNVAYLGALYAWEGGQNYSVSVGPGGGKFTYSGPVPGTTTPPAGSVVTPPVKIDPPKILDVYVGNRLYFKDLVSKGDKFYTSKKAIITTTIKAKDGIDTKNLTIKVIDSQGVSTSYVLSDANIPLKKTKGNLVTQCDIIYNIKNLGVGENNVEIQASNPGGVAKETLKLTVVSGMSVIGEVVVFPSPFSIPNDKIATIQYTLSEPISVDIYITSVGGRIVKKISLPANMEGGNGGTNKVAWDGTTDSGELAGNGIYVGTIVSGGRILKKFKFTIKN